MYNITREWLRQTHCIVNIIKQFLFRIVWKYTIYPTIKTQLMQKKFTLFAYFIQLQCIFSHLDFNHSNTLLTTFCIIIFKRYKYFCIMIFMMDPLLRDPLLKSCFSFYLLLKIFIVIQLQLSIFLFIKKINSASLPGMTSQTLHVCYSENTILWGLLQHPLIVTFLASLP